MKSATGKFMGWASAGLIGVALALSGCSNSDKTEANAIAPAFNPSGTPEQKTVGALNAMAMASDAVAQSGGISPALASPPANLEPRQAWTNTLATRAANIYFYPSSTVTININVSGRPCFTSGTFDASGSASFTDSVSYPRTFSLSVTNFTVLFHACNDSQSVANGTVTANIAESVTFSSDPNSPPYNVDVTIDDSLAIHNLTISDAYGSAGIGTGLLTAVGSASFAVDEFNNSTLTAISFAYTVTVDRATCSATITGPPLILSLTCN